MARGVVAKPPFVCIGEVVATMRNAVPPWTSGTKLRVTGKFDDEDVAQPVSMPLLKLSDCACAVAAIANSVVSAKEAVWRRSLIFRGAVVGFILYLYWI